MKKTTVLTASFFASTLLCSAGISWLTCSLNAPMVVEFDMKSTLDAFVESTTRRSLDEAQAKELSERFNAALEASLQDWQARHNGLILVAPAVVRGAPDITRDIQKDVARRMKDKS